MTTNSSIPPSMKDRKPSIMVRKFLQDSGKEREDDPNHDYDAFQKQYYFFYGTLMDASTLSRVLHLKDRPTLHDATVVGYKIMLWGPYPALLDGPLDQIVKGVAYEVQSAEEARRLQDYETERYAERPCLITLANGEQVWGMTFKWSADRDELREGSFDLKDWQMERLERKS